MPGVGAGTIPRVQDDAGPGRFGPRARLAVLVVAVAVAGVAAMWASGRDGSSASAPAATSTAAASLPPGAPGTTPRGTTPPSSTTAPTTVAVTTLATTTTVPYQGWVDPASSGQAWSATVNGMLTFRGNPTRTWYGSGPVPSSPRVLWRFPAAGGLCHPSSAGGVTKTWCGTGWTGQASVFERDGRTWVVFGSMGAAYHFLDGDTGARILPDLPTGDINKGSATIDPDGFPLLYGGSRDNYLRVVAFDRDEPTVLWKLNASDVRPTKWNNDWDGAPLVIDDYLFVGGENSRFHIIELNRGYGPDGKVTVAPELVFHAAGWDDQLLRDIGDSDVSIENSVAISGNTVYFANSGGLVQGWDISGVKEGRDPERVFRFWTGDDTDASIVVDAEGYLYVASEYQRFLPRGREVGQLMKLDPRRPDDPLVWSVADNDYRGFENAAGIWSTPALHKGVVITTTNGGRVMGVDAASGEVLWTKRLAAPVWMSPVVVDDVLLQGDCDGTLRAFDVRDPRADPPELWRVKVGGCLESTPTVFGGRIYLGSRSGAFYALG